MNAQETVWKLAEHLLGEDFYIVDPVGNEQANEVIYEEIIANYRCKDESPENRYRRKHKRCIWCRHAIRRFDISGFRYCYTCEVKDKEVNPHKPRPFCSVYFPLPFKPSDK